jgi:DNA-binding response OmpR family regulator
MRILVVEDNVSFGRLLKHVLELEKYTVEIAYDGIKGFEMAKNGNYNAILLDIMLPGKDGYTILKELRDGCVSTPIMILTVLHTPEDISKGFKLGANDYLSKDNIVEELIPRLERIIMVNQQPPPPPTTELPCGDLILDTINHLAYKNGKEIELTKKEYDLLKYFIKNKNIVLSRTLISKEVWKDEIEPDCNLIDVFVKKLRTKLNSVNSKQVIKAIHGVGYRLIEVSID